MEIKSPFNITFVEDKHVYYVGAKKVGVSVTGFISKFFPKFDAVAKAKAEVEKGIQSKYHGMTAGQIIDMWDKNGQESMQQGRDMHKIIERYFKKELGENEYSITLAQYIQWLLTSGNTQLQSEFIVYNPDCDIAGSIDGIYKTKDDKLMLVDFKRIASIELTDKYEHRTAFDPISDMENCNGAKYFLQLNMYKYFLEKYYGLKIDKMCLLLLHPTKTTFEEIEVPNLTMQVEKLLATRQVKKEVPWGWNGDPNTKED